MRDHRGAVRRGPLVSAGTVLVLVAGLTAGCTGASDDPDPTPSATPLSDIDLTGLEPSRTAFCDDLDPAALESVLGGEPTDETSYDSGQRAALAPGLEDVASEYSCFFERGPDDVRTARAWLFAQAVTEGQAKAWIEEREQDKECSPAGELVFGDPGLIQRCTSGTRLRVTAVGLFADSWLTCQTTAPSSADAEELVEETQRWCASVATTTAF